MKMSENDLLSLGWTRGVDAWNLLDDKTEQKQSVKSKLKIHIQILESMSDLQFLFHHYKWQLLF